MVDFNQDFALNIDALRTLYESARDIVPDIVPYSSFERFLLDVVHLEHGPQPIRARKITGHDEYADHWTLDIRHGDSWLPVALVPPVRFERHNAGENLASAVERVARERSQSARTERPL